MCVGGECSAVFSATVAVAAVAVVVADAGGQVGVLDFAARATGSAQLAG